MMFDERLETGMRRSLEILSPGEKGRSVGRPDADRYDLTADK